MKFVYRLLYKVHNRKLGWCRVPSSPFYMMVTDRDVQCIFKISSETLRLRVSLKIFTLINWDSFTVVDDMMKVQLLTRNQFQLIIKTKYTLKWHLCSYFFLEKKITLRCHVHSVALHYYQITVFAPRDKHLQKCFKWVIARNWTIPLYIQNNCTRPQLS